MSSEPSPALTPRLRELSEALGSARSRLLETLQGLDQARLDAVPADGQWSIGEILHHLALIEAAVVRVLSRQLERAEKSGDAADGSSDSVLSRLDAFDIEDSPEKIPTPAGFVPTRGRSKQELVDDLARSRAALLAEMKRAAAHDLGRLVFPHPVLGRLDMYQWLLYAAQHELRHLHQIERTR